MKCIYCGETESKVIDSRVSEDGTSIRRRRECIACGKRFTTYEKIEPVAVYVIKKSGNRQPFDAQKIRAGIIRACEKRPVPISKINNLIAEIEKNVYNMPDNEIQSSKIGDLVMQGLKDIDDVAYVRFASVYRQFKDINTLLLEIKDILNAKSGENK
ncbi:MAG: transcriptional regulator NrdR [Clostridiales bacterium]|jgi:transcriptional repressor NrdR|nr:transcriptional regulator NrdR [Clostridiales bacterium]